MARLFIFASLGATLFGVLGYRVYKKFQVIEDDDLTCLSVNIAVVSPWTSGAETDRCDRVYRSSWLQQLVRMMSRYGTGQVGRRRERQTTHRGQVTLLYAGRANLRRSPIPSS